MLFQMYTQTHWYLDVYFTCLQHQFHTDSVGCHRPRTKMHKTK